MSAAPALLFLHGLDRSKFIGSSDCSSILGVNPWKSARQLYDEKIGEYIEEISPQKERIFSRGKRWESVVIEMLVDELESRGHDVEILCRNNRYRDPEYDFLAAEIDLEILLDGEHVNAEMKTVHPFAVRDWGEEETDEIPMYYLAQVLHAQMVTNRSKTIVAALIGADDLRVHVVNRDDEMIQFIREKEIEFWQRIQNRTPPDAVSSDDVKRLYQHDSGAVIEADKDILNMVGELQRLRSENKILETNIENLNTKIKTLMGEASAIIYQGTKIVTWHSNKECTRIDWQAAYMALNPPPEHINSFVTVKPGARPFKLKTNHG